jgi:hypothetical protein
MIWRVEGYASLGLAVVFLAVFIWERNRTSLGLAGICALLGVTGLADSLDRSLVPVLLPITLAGLVGTVWLIERSRHKPPQGPDDVHGAS